jgi:hypothetical protein
VEDHRKIERGKGYLINVLFPWQKNHEKKEKTAGHLVGREAKKSENVSISANEQG